MTKSVPKLGLQVSKNPITDRGKKSKRGRLTLENNDGVFSTVENGDPAKDCLVTVFEDGALTKEYTYDEIRANGKDLSFV